jgi:tRNA nucleotidyltransferase/poly(A) polymerase
MLGISLRSLKNRITAQTIVKGICSKPITGKIYLVGGAIRELYLGRAPNDYDIALSLQGDLKVLEELFGTGAFVLGKKPIQAYRIVKKDLSIDITFLNTPIDEDLARRDFTMNAIAYDILEGMVIDPLGGIEDIKKKTIRCPSKEALKDDPLRMLKAIRHYSVMKGFALQEELIQSIRELKSLIGQTAPERIKYEMDRIVVSENSFGGLRLMEVTGLLFELFPELQALRQMDIEKKFTLETYGHTIDGFKHLRKYGRKYGLDEKSLREVGYALLFHDLGKAYTFSYDEQKNLVHFFYHERFSNEIASLIMGRLRFSSHEMNLIHRIIENHMRVFLISSSDSTEKALKRLVYKIEELTPSLIVHTMCDMFGSSGGQENVSTKRVEKKCHELMECFNDWKKEPLPKVVDGHDLINLGFRQGPQLGKLLADIRERQISGEIKDKGEAILYARGFLNT